MKKLTEEQKKKLYNNLAICFAVIGLVSEALILIVPWGLYAITKNWAFIVFFLIAQLGIMPVIFIICGLGGIVCSILAIRKNQFKVRIGGWITTQASWDDEINNVVIHYHDGSSIDVWKNGEFYSLREAYEQGFLTKEELKEIADIHNNRYLR